MSFLKNHRRRLTFFLVSVSMILIPLFIYSCGSNDYSDYYNNPDNDENVQVMMTPEEINDLATNGNSNMVILHLGTQQGYSEGHVPGALFVDQSTEIRTTRSDGVADIIVQVATNSMMDTIIQRTGIDGASTVVITGQNMQIVGLLYFNFRYWGFPKRRLRVMNGTTTTYANAGFTLATAPTPAPAEPSTYSVCELDQSISVDGVRASLEEMITVAEDSAPDTLPYDVRSIEEYNGTKGRKDVEFEGRIKGAVWQEWKELLDGGTPADPFKSKAEIESIVTAVGMSSSKTAYIYCQTATRTGVTFLAIDAILGWKVKKYDSSWVEWGNMTNDGVVVDDQGNPVLDKDGKEQPAPQLQANSPWRTDTAARSEAINYESVNKNKLSANSFAFNANQVNEDDKECGGGGGGDGGGGGGGGY